MPAIYRPYSLFSIAVLACSAGAIPAQAQTATAVEADDARQLETGRTLGLSVDARIDPATGKLFDAGSNQLALDPVSGAVLGQGSAGDIFLQAQFPLHSGRILGLPGRILISVMGVAVAGFSATGLLIWLRKRRFRRRLL